MPSWTPSQLQVIESRSRHLICSAAAGSGKTAVMIERILRMLKEGAEPGSLLVVTFTNMAASEMKEKIRRRLQEESDNPCLRNARDQIDCIQISTIHAFCQQLIRNQFQLIPIDPNFSICDASMQERLFHEAFADACNELEQNGEPFFALLKERYTVRQAEAMIRTLHPFLMSLANPFEWLSDRIDDIPDRMEEDHPWFRVLRQMAEDQLFQAQLYLDQMERMFSDPDALPAYQEAWKKDAELFHVKQREIRENRLDAAPAVFEKLKAVRGVTVQESDWRDRYQEIRKKYRQLMESIDRYQISEPEKPLSEWKNMRESLLALQCLMRTTENLFQMKKAARSLADFSDLEQYAVKILKNPAGREEAHAIWKNIFVDECQDISEVQNQIIDLLQGPETSLFMVGDVKQSIYRFRLADPMMFLERIRNCRSSEGEDQECIFLQSNFRSRPEILETTNRIFESIMKEKVTEITYGPEERLIPGRQTEGHVPVEVCMIQKGDTGKKDLEATAELIETEIRKMLRQPCPGENRTYQYRDFVVLLPTVQTDGPLLAGYLEERGIPVFFDGKGEYYQLDEIQEIRNLLEWIDSPLQDLPLISVLQSSPFFFREEELSLIRLRNMDSKTPFYEIFERVAQEPDELGKKCHAVLEKRREWQNLAETARVPDLIWKLYQETDLYAVSGVDLNGEVKQANLRMLCQQASDAETLGILTLSDFLSYMRDQQAFGDQQSATLLGEKDNLVRIMTIHKSKGLQFPVVFCGGMDKSPAGRKEGEIKTHSKLGLCVNYKDAKNRISRPTLADELFDWQKTRDEMSEKVRLLYVAMTRAQEKLYLITCQETNPLWSAPEGYGRILAAKSFTDWWMPVLMQENRKKISTSYEQPEMPYEIRVFECNQPQNVEKPEVIHNTDAWLETLLSGPVVDELWKTPEKEEKSPTLQKRSVTSLIRSARRGLEEQEEETPETKRMPDLLARKLRGEEMQETPAFLREKKPISAAWRGTITHRILSLLDLEEIRNGASVQEAVQRETDRMRREHMASEEELKQIRPDQIVRFWNSPTGKRILSSPEVHREWNFNLLLRREQEIILQGVIDCAFLEGDEWVILDYKTDSGKTADELAEEYRPQLMWYAQALQKITGRKVKEASLYALSMERLIPVFCQKREED